MFPILHEELRNGVAKTFDFGLLKSGLHCYLLSPGTAHLDKQRTLKARENKKIIIIIIGIYNI